MKKVFGVIGLGRFGFNVAKTLAEGGAEVIACDVDEEKVKAIAELVSQAFILDATDEKAETVSKRAGNSFMFSISAKNIAVIVL